MAEQDNEFSGNTSQGEPTNVRNFGSQQPQSLQSTDSIQESAKGVVEQAKNTAQETYGIVSEKASAKLDEHKNEFSSSLTNVADGVRKAGQELKNTDDKMGLTSVAARYSDAAAGHIEKAANYFERSELKDMVSDAKEFAKQNPAIVLGGAFALGILAARFLKSSPGPTPSEGKSFGDTSGFKPESRSASAGGKF